MMAQSASSPNLLLIAGFNQGANVQEVIQYVQFTFPDNKVLGVWMDPLREGRAVFLFDQIIEIQKWQDMCMDKKLKGSEILLSIVKPTSSIFVNTYGKIKPAKIKLKMLFQTEKIGGSIVKNVQPLSFNQNCFEIVFENGWDAVMVASQHDWKLKDQKLTAYPYFECFKEPADEQLKRLINLKNSSRESSLERSVKESIKPQIETSTKALGKLNKDPQRPLPNQSENLTVTGSDGIQDSETKFKSQLSNDTVCTDTSTDYPKRKDSEIGQKKKKKACILLHNDSFCFVLSLLYFDKALQEFCNDLQVKIDEQENEVIIKGPAEIVKVLQNMLFDADKKVNLPVCARDFLNMESVQDTLRAGLQSTRHMLKLGKENEKIQLYLIDGQGKKERHTIKLLIYFESIPFQEFVTSLVTIQKCTSLPKELRENQGFKEFYSMFNELNESHQMFLENESVMLMSLSCSFETKTKKDIVNRKIEELAGKIRKQPVTNSSQIDNSEDNAEVLNSSQNVSSDVDSRKSDVDQEGRGDIRKDSTREKSSRNSKGKPKVKKTTLICIHQSFVRLLDVLRLNDALHRISSDVCKELNKERGEVTISGPKENRSAVTSQLTEVDVQMTDEQDMFLCDEKIWKSLERHLNNCFFVVESNETLALSVSSDKNDRQTPFQEFVTSLVIVRKCMSLPKESRENQEWKEFYAKFNDTNDSHQIILENKSVMLMSLSLTIDTDTKLDIVNKKIEELAGKGRKENSSDINSEC